MLLGDELNSAGCGQPALAALPVRAAAGPHILISHVELITTDTLTLAWRQVLTSEIDEGMDAYHVVPGEQGAGAGWRCAACPGAPAGVVTADLVESRST